jgi:hypothetical protein
MRCKGGTTQQRHRSGGGLATPALVLLLSFTLLLFAVPSVAEALPKEFSARYIATARGFTVGRADLTLQREGEAGYRYSSSMRATGAIGLVYRSRIREHSSGALTPQGVQPLTYDYARTGSGGREDSIRFAPSQNEALLHYKGETRAEDVPSYAIDPLSLHLALMHDIANGAETMRYLVAEPRRLKAYELRVTGRERVRTPNGVFEAVRVDVTGDVTVDDMAGFNLATVEIQPMEEGDGTTFWFAPELGYLAVRIRHEDADDGVGELHLSEIRSLATR